MESYCDQKTYGIRTGIQLGLGKHLGQVDQSNITPFGKVRLNSSSTSWIPCILTSAPTQIVFVQQITWALATSLTILAILLFYVRVFPNTWMRKAVYVIATWDLLWAVCTLAVTIIQCIPIRNLWQRDVHEGTCINLTAFYFSTGLISTLSIIAILLLPLPIIYNLRTSNAKKMGLVISFTVGALYVNSICAFASFLTLLLTWRVPQTVPVPQVWPG